MQHLVDVTTQVLKASKVSRRNSQILKLLVRVRVYCVSPRHSQSHLVRFRRRSAATQWHTLYSWNPDIELSRHQVDCHVQVSDGTPPLTLIGDIVACQRSLRQDSRPVITHARPIIVEQGCTHAIQQHFVEIVSRHTSRDDPSRARSISNPLGVDGVGDWAPPSFSTIGKDYEARQWIFVVGFVGIPP